MATTPSGAAQRFSDSIVLVTGATGGLGTELSKALAREGATVVLLGRNLAKLEALYDVLEAADAAQPAMLTLDFAEAEQADIAGLANTLYAEFGRLDGIVHTAATLGKLSPMGESPLSDWDRLMRVNASVPLALTASCLPLLQRAPRASVVFTLDRKQSAYWGPYGVSKSALETGAGILADETEGARDDTGAPRVAINALDPGPMRTQLRRRAFPGELAEESPGADTRVPAFLDLLARTDPTLTGAARESA